VTRHCLDLFSGRGGFSAAFRDDPDWSVTEVDIAAEHNPDIEADIMELQPSDLPEADVILASPPCTDFSPVAWSHGVRVTQNGEPQTESAAESIALVYHALGLIKAKAPLFWFLENPRGALRFVIGEPVATIDYCRYGHYTKKPTDLWGNHPTMSYLRCDHNSHTRDDGVTDFELGPSDPSDRAKVPRGLSETILNAVENRSEQAALTGFE
jgi:hypothetical protein